MISGALDPRGGMEAALVLKENSQQPWKEVEGRGKAAENTEQGQKESAGRIAAESKRHVRSLRALQASQYLPLQ